MDYFSLKGPEEKSNESDTKKGHLSEPKTKENTS